MSFHLSLIINCYIKRKMKQSPLLKPLVTKDFHRGLKLYSLLYFVINGLTVSISFLLLSVLVSDKYPLLWTCMLKATWVPTTASLGCITSALHRNLPYSFPTYTHCKKRFPQVIQIPTCFTAPRKDIFFKRNKNRPSAFLITRQDRENKLA